MNRAEHIVDSLLSGAPVAPPKPTTKPTTKPAPAKPRPGTKPWSPTPRRNPEDPDTTTTPKPKARKKYPWMHEAEMYAKKKQAKPTQKPAGHETVNFTQYIGGKPVKTKIPFYKVDGYSVKEAEGSVPVPPAAHDDNPTAQPTPAPMQSLCDIIRAGDIITFQKPGGMGRQGREYITVRGRAVMRNRQYGCWVVNLGGRHGTPGIADEENILGVKRGGRVIYGK